MRYRLLAVLVLPSLAWSFGNVQDVDWTYVWSDDSASVTPSVAILSAQAGDGLVLHCSIQGDDFPWSAGPSGSGPWNFIGSRNSGSGPKVFLYDLEATGNETDQAYTLDSAMDAACWVYKFSGPYDSGAIIDQFAIDSSGGLDSSPSITPSISPSFVFSVVADEFQDEYGNVPPGMTLVYQEAFEEVGDANRWHGSAFESYTTTDPTGLLTWHDIIGRATHTTFNVVEIESGVLANECAADTLSVTAGTTGDSAEFQPCRKRAFPDLVDTVGDPILSLNPDYYVAGCRDGGWTATTLPAGISITENANGLDVLTGTPTTGGTVSASITCTTPVGALSTSFTWTINPAEGGEDQGTDLDVAGTYFWDADASPGGDGTSPGSAWDSYADVQAHSFVANERLYLKGKATGSYDFSGSTNSGWTNFHIGSYYVDGGTAVACHEGSDVCVRPTAVSNSSGHNCGELPWVHGVTSGAMFTFDSVTGTLDGICSDGDMDTTSDHGWNATGLSSEPTSSVEKHVDVLGSANVTIRRSHFEDAKGWFGIRAQSGATLAIYDITGGDHGYWCMEDPGPETDCNFNQGNEQLDRGNFMEFLAGSTVLVEGGNFRGGGHDLLNIETCNAVIRFSTFDGELGAVGSGIGQKTVEVRTNCQPFNGWLYANRIINTLPTVIDNEEGSNKTRGDEVLWAFNEFETQSFHTFSLGSDNEHRNGDDQCFFGNEFTNYGSGDEFNGNILYLSKLASNPDPFYASRLRFFNNGVGANQAATPRFLHMTNDIGDDPGEGAWNGMEIFNNLFADAAAELRRTSALGGGVFDLETAEASVAGFHDNSFSSALTATTGGGNVATITSATGSGTSFDVDFENCLRGPLAGADGFDITVNGTDVQITGISGSTVTVDGTVSWTQGDAVNLTPMMNGSSVRRGMPPSITPGAP